MSSQINSFNYSKTNRLKEIRDKIEKCMTQEIIDKLMNDLNDSNIGVYKYSQRNKSYSNVEALRSIQKNIEELKKDIKSIGTNGEENRFLLFEAKGDKLLKKLDAFGDLSEQKFEKFREERRIAIQQLKELSECLKKSSIENLKQLLKTINCYINRIPHEYENYENLFNTIETFTNESKSPSIKEIDDYRFQLEEIKNKIIFDEN
jgi:t-SNARE complex subunit (syntaxin)